MTPPEGVMRDRSCLYAVLLSCFALAWPAAAQQKVNADAKVLADFQSRIAKYMELHKQLERESPRLEQTKDPAAIQRSQAAMAAKLQAARKGARQGEIFTPEVQAVIRRLLNPELKGPDAADTKKAVEEDAPKGVPLKVNAKYPENAPLPTVPPNLLAALPRLPEDLEYRFVHRHLILRDVHADVIVDYIPNALKPLK
jgi:hypothetical protein